MELDFKYPHCGLREDFEAQGFTPVLTYLILGHLEGEALERERGRPSLLVDGRDLDQVVAARSQSFHRQVRRRRRHICNHPPRCCVLNLQQSVAGSRSNNVEQVHLFLPFILL